MEKINLLLHPDNYTSFHQSSFQTILKDYFNFLYVDQDTVYNKNNTLLVSNFAEDRWYTSLHEQGYRVLIDNLWGIGTFNLNNSFLLINKNWFWYHEALLAKSKGFDQTTPNKTYTKLALVPMGLQKPSHDMLYEGLIPWLDECHWSYVNRFNKFLPDDIESWHPMWQRYVNPMWYNDTYFSIVSETIISNDFDLHVTEKTYKPIAYQHPFMVFGQSGILAHLHQQGFETFNNLFDETYDQLTSPESRLEQIITNVKHFKKYPYDKITQDKLQHNHNLFFDTELIKQKIIEEIAKPIIEYFEKS
jgi:hypothetical protein